MYLTTKQQLKDIYAAPSKSAIEKEVARLDEVAMDFIAQSPLVVISTFDTEGKINTSPRGGQAGFVKILSDSHLLIPDAKGNNRLDSLHNIIETGKIGCLFMLPDSNETLRVNGTAKISIDETYLNLDFSLRKPPVTCIEIELTDVFLHCPLSLTRAKEYSTHIL